MTAKSMHLVRKIGSGLVAAVLCLAVLPAESTAQTKTWADGSDARPTSDDLIPKLHSAEAYSERYGLLARLDGGGKVKINFTISNLGWSDAKGAAQVVVKMPGEDKYKFKKKVNKGDWSYSKKNFKLDIADTVIESKGKRKFELRHDGKVKVRLTMTSDTPMWSPGRGRLDVGDGYMKINMFALRSTAKGKVKIGGEWREVKSTRGAYGDHVSTNIAPYDLATRFSKARVYDDENDVFFLWREIKLTEDNGGDSITWMMVGYKDKIVFSDPDAEIKFGKVRKDKVGYEIPYAVQLEGKDGEDKVKLVMRAKKMRRTDLLKSYGNLVRMVASSVSKPFNYNFRCEYALEMQIQGAKATVRGKGGYVVDYLNKE